MAELNGTNVSAAIVPNDSQDVFATHLASYGDYNQHVETIELRDAIPVNPGYLNEDGQGSGRRSLGMTVTVGGDDPDTWSQYRLTIPLFFRMSYETKLTALADNSNWRLVENAIYSMDGGTASDKSFHPSALIPKY
jgi:hypothetical protein